MDRIIRLKRFIYIGISILLLVIIVLLYLINKRENISTKIPPPIRNPIKGILFDQDKEELPPYKKQIEETPKLQERKQILESKIITDKSVTLKQNVSEKVIRLFTELDIKETSQKNQQKNLKRETSSTNIETPEVEIDFVIDEFKTKNSEFRRATLLKRLKQNEVKVLEDLRLIKSEKSLPNINLKDRSSLFSKAKAESRESEYQNFFADFIFRLDDPDILLKVAQTQIFNTSPTPSIPKITPEIENDKTEEIITSLEKTSTEIIEKLYLSTQAESIDELLKEVGKKVGVPFGVLKGVLMIEGPKYLDLDSDKVKRYSKSGYIIPGCTPNVCSATGPMQITIGYDQNGSNLCPSCCWQGSCLNTKGGCPNQWAIYGSAVQKYFDNERIPNPCNLLDNFYAAAAKLKRDSRTGSKNTNWSKDEVYRASLRYYGNCTIKYKRLLNKTYCEFVYYIYKQLGD